MSVCHPDILISLHPLSYLLKPLGLGSHPWGGVNGNPVLALDYFSLVERLVQSLVRPIAFLLTTRGFPLADVQTPHRRSFCRSRLYSLVAAVGARLPISVFVLPQVFSRRTDPREVLRCAGHALDWMHWPANAQ
jgi:hypothetical protein